MLPAAMTEHIAAQTRLVEAQAMHEVAAAYFLYEAMTLCIVIFFVSLWQLARWKRSVARSMDDDMARHRRIQQEIDSGCRRTSVDITLPE